MENRVNFGALTITQKAKDLINQALADNRLTSGKLVSQLEKEFAAWIGRKFAIAVSSGTDALAISLAALKEMCSEVSDEVVVPALTFIATANAAVMAGFKPVFVDVFKNSLTMDVGKLRRVVNYYTAAVLPVHLMGKAAHIDEIKDTINARERGIFLIEDAAEAHGGKYKDRNIGTFGIASCFSLYAAHIISSVEGGMITTDNEEFATYCRSLRNHGRACACEVCIINVDPKRCPKRYKSEHDTRFDFDRIGFSSKMNELEAAVGLGTIEIADKIVEIRRENYFKLLEGFSKFDEFLLMGEKPYEKIGPHAFPIILKEGVSFTRDQYADYLSKVGIDSRNLFQSIPTQTRAYRNYGYKLGDFPVAEYIGNNGLHIGVHQDLDDESINYIIESTEEFLLKQSS
jgi:dTDP-4-amino-4,6-dideoxygalactose transaminase